MRVYCAGPMTGRENNNREAFSFAWNRLHEAGVDAVSPHFLESAIEIETRSRMGTAAVYRHVLPVDCFAISSVDAVLALPGWEQSRGCLFEKHYADLIEIPWIAADPEQFQPDWSYDDSVRFAVAYGIARLKELAVANPCRS